MDYRYHKSLKNRWFKHDAMKLFESENAKITEHMRHQMPNKEQKERGEEEKNVFRPIMPCGKLMSVYKSTKKL